MLSKKFKCPFLEFCHIIANKINCFSLDLCNMIRKCKFLTLNKEHCIRNIEITCPIKGNINKPCGGAPWYATRALIWHTADSLLNTDKHTLLNQ